MSHEEAQAIGLALMNAGYSVQIVLSVDEPPETCYSVIAEMKDTDRETWMFVHLRHAADIAALGVMVTRMQEEQE